MPSEEVSVALEGGRAFVDLSSWHKVAVSGPRALAWLSTVGSADVEDLAPGRARPTSIPCPGEACEVTVALAGGNVIVLQDPAQPRSIHDALTRLVGDESVGLDDRTAALALFGFPGAGAAPDVAGTAFSAPSCLGAGVDVFALAEDHDYLLGSLQHGFKLVGLDDARAWLGRRTASS